MLPVIFAILILSASKYGQGATECPQKRDITPCTCQIVTPKETETWINCGYISSLPELTSAVNGMKGFLIDKFVLEQSDIGYIPSNMFLHNAVREIIIKSMTLDNIGTPGEYILQGQQNTLQSIAIRRCKLNSDKFEDWDKLNRLNILESLELNKNDLSNFSASWFRFGSKSMKYVYLTENRIKEIADDAFSAVTELTMLDLSENQISKLSRTMFPMPAERLIYFHFNDNKIRTIPEDLFSSMGVLQRVNFANNLLQTIDGKVWKQKFSHLSHLDLLGNPIQCDCKILWTVEVLKPDFYFGECENAKDGGTKKLFNINAWELNNCAKT